MKTPMSQGGKQADVRGGAAISTVVEAGAEAVPARRLGLRAWARSAPVMALLVIAASTLMGGLFALPMMANGGWRQAAAQWWAWGLMAPLIVLADRRLPFKDREFGKRAAAHAAMSLVFVGLYLYVFYVFRALLGEVPWSKLWPPARMFMATQLEWFLWSSLIYWTIVCGLQAYRYHGRYVGMELSLERMEKSYSQARLNALRMQLDPHFLFNALNTISSHVERDPRLTRRMIEHLGDLLRLSLETKDRQEVPLAEELAFLEHYLEIQRIRFGDQLEVHIEVTPEVRYASVPSLILQPIVENAIRHGISRRITGGWIAIEASAEDGRLSICVEDDGVGLPTGWSLEKSNGLGLSVTRERLAGLYPGQNHFAVRRRAEGGTRVDMVLPLRMAGVEDDTV